VNNTESYLSSQLIAYIGNKRRLRGFLEEVFSELEDRSCAGGHLRFGDVFAGSGSVSRLAKSMGFGVGTNDWELYSWILNKTHIELSPEILTGLFADEDGIDDRLDYLNSLYGAESVEAGEAYISRYYAPEKTASADYRYERLFYTRENAVFIDNVRNTVESWYPGWDLSERDSLKKAALIAPLLYQAATHANTNGVFKACHKGFGGHGSDALSRIMAEMKLQKPVLIENLPGRDYFVGRMDAVDFCCGQSFDICYLDPPYNQHQYGSNYFMLNTIALWDKLEVSGERKPDGSLSVKAGIRPDWINTRSGFCYRKTAPRELRTLIENVDSQYIVLSYNTEGIIPFDELFEILSSFGRTEIFCRDYVIYRGGKQSIGRSNRNVEFQLVLSRNEMPKASDKKRIDRILLARSIVSLMNESFTPERILKKFSETEGRIDIGMKGQGPYLQMEGGYKFSEVPGLSEFEKLSEVELKSLRSSLELCRCVNKEEEARVLMSLIKKSGVQNKNDASYTKYWNELLRTLRKFAFKKYRDEFNYIYEDMKALFAEEQRRSAEKDFRSIEKKIIELKRVADLRINS
jgi:adenine-specific DNA-methyltransferase